MREKKYLQLSSAAAALKAKLNVNSTQLLAFVQRCGILSQQMIVHLDQIHVASNNLSGSDMAKKYLSEIQKLKLSFKRSVENPVSDFQKNLARIEKEIYTKILPALDKDPEPNSSNLNSIRSVIEECKPLISSMQQNLATCFAQMTQVQAKLEALETKLNTLELPGVIAKDIASIQSKLLLLRSSPHKGVSSDLVDSLGATLESLRMSQTEENETEKSSSPRPSLQRG